MLVTVYTCQSDIMTLTMQSLVADTRLNHWTKEAIGYRPDHQSYHIANQIFGGPRGPTGPLQTVNNVIHNICPQLPGSSLNVTTSKFPGAKYDSTFRLYHRSESNLRYKQFKFTILNYSSTGDTQQVKNLENPVWWWLLQLSLLVK